jgi:hypothetical protein
MGGVGGGPSVGVSTSSPVDVDETVGLLSEEGLTAGGQRAQQQYQAASKLG